MNENRFNKLDLWSEKGSQRLKTRTFNNYNNNNIREVYQSENVLFNFGFYVKLTENKNFHTTKR